MKPPRNPTLTPLCMGCRRREAVERVIFRYEKDMRLDLCGPCLDRELRENPDAMIPPLVPGQPTRIVQRPTR